MSSLFGRWNYDGKAVDPEYIGKVRAILDAQSPGGVTICLKSTFVILYGALHVTEESPREGQPAVSPSGTFLTWDGRLDNRTELQSMLDRHTSGASDLEIVAESWEQQGPRC